MKITYGWLKDFVEIKISPQQLAQRLTMAGLEVTCLENKLGDFVFEIEVTSNRPDCLSVAGIAREVAAVTNAKYRAYSVGRIADGKTSLSAKRYPLNAETLKINIENKKDCSLYTAKIIRDVKVGPSPDWLKARLELIGCRSVNNVADITNYIMFEQGHPLHAFDLDKLTSGGIAVRRGHAGEKIVIIGGQQKALDSGILVIADNKGPVAIAGIMGSADTAVSPGTRNILLEAAVFDPLVVRRGGRQLGLASESAYRFERGVDIEAVESAAARAARLIQQVCGGGCVLATSSGSAKGRKKTVLVAASSVRRILGVDLPAPKMRRIWNNLGFAVKPQAKDKFLVTAPSYRHDISSEIDLIEEAARIFGYANIPTTRAAVMTQIIPDTARQRIALLKDALIGLGLQEVITPSLIDQGALGGLGLSCANSVEIANPLSQEQALLRPTLIPSLLKCVAYNLNQKQDYVPIFEIAKVFSAPAQEELVVGIALCGAKSWLSPEGAVKEELGILHLKGILESVFARLGIEEHKFCASGHAGRFAVYAKEELIGAMEFLPAATLKRLDIKNRTAAVGELFLDKLFARAKLQAAFRKPPAYPGISRDISVVLRQDLGAEQVLALIKEKAGPLLSQARIVDCYQGSQIPAGFKGLTVSCFYRAQERTLTEEEITPALASIAASLQEEFGAKIR